MGERDGPRIRVGLLQEIRGDRALERRQGVVEVCELRGRRQRALEAEHRSGDDQTPGIRRTPSQADHHMRAEAPWARKRNVQALLLKGIGGELLEQGA
ncbi:MAG: hypothetical protein ACREQ5_29500, partial [Candidatus Dormibacteria bacterium]